VAITSTDWYAYPGGPSCYELRQYGTDTVSSTVPVPGETGTSTTATPAVVQVAAPTGEPKGVTGAGSITVAGYGSGDASILTQQDVGECSPPLAASTTTARVIGIT
jgi:hypothetical protein